MSLDLGSPRCFGGFTGAFSKLPAVICHIDLVLQHWQHCLVSVSKKKILSLGLGWFVGKTRIGGGRSHSQQVAEEVESHGKHKNSSHCSGKHEPGYLYALKVGLLPRIAVPRTMDWGHGGCGVLKAECEFPFPAFMSSTVRTQGYY